MDPNMQPNQPQYQQPPQQAPTPPPQPQYQQPQYQQPPQPNNDNKKFIKIAVIAVVVLLLAALIPFIFLGSSNTANNPDPNLEGQANSINYLRLVESNKVAANSSEIKGIEMGDSSVFIYEEVGSGKTYEANLGDGCLFSADDMKAHYSGIVVSRNTISGQNLSFESIDQIAELYTTIEVEFERVEINGKQVLKLDESGDGFITYCFDGDAQVARQLDFGAGYVYLAEDGSDILVSSASTVQTVDGEPFDSEIESLSGGVFDEADLLKEVEYVVNNN